MATSEIDFLNEIKVSGILPDRSFQELQTKVQNGEYPAEGEQLAMALVEDKTLSQYQAKRLLTGRGKELMIGKYILLDRVGKGSMGEVYKAQHYLMGRTVALKRIAGEVSANDKAVYRFQREMRMVGRLDHPNVIRAFDADARGKLMYLVMEFDQGKSLMEKLRLEGPMKPADVVNYMAQAARGLNHAHDQGIVHRDIEPSNLLITDQNILKILDLGLGVLMERDPGTSFETADGIAVGTIDFMSPEQALGKEVDGRSDLFNLGCSMYYLLSGRFPFPGNNQIERLGKRINGRPVPIKDFRPELPDRLIQIMDKLLATKPQDRYQTGNEAADALESLIRKKDAPAPAAAAPAPAPVAASAAPAPAPAHAAPTSAPSVKIISPKYPGWFGWLAKMGQGSGVGALVVLFLGASMCVGLGYGLSLVVPK